MKPQETRILGIDPGTTIVGYAVIDKNQSKLELVEYGTCQTKPKIPLEDKLEEIYCDIIKIIDKFKPQILAVETLFFFKNAKTAFDVGQARGVIVLAGKQKKLAICNLTPLQVKSAITGNGRADKLQVQKMVQKTLKMDHLPKQDDAADAIAIAICGADLNTKFFQ